MTVTRIAAPAIAGVPIEHVVHDGIVPVRTAMPAWTGSRTAFAPLVIHHQLGSSAEIAPSDDDRRSLELAHCTFWRTRAGETHLRFAAMGDFPPQVVRPIRAGEEYAITYAEPPRDPLVHGTRDRTLFALALAERGVGLTTHAVGWLSPGGAVIAAGESGAGKSTLARCLREADATIRVLSDDRVALTGEANAVRAWGTPWCSAANALDVGDALVGAVILPAKGPKVAVRSLGAVERTQRLLSLLSLPLWSADAMDVALLLADRLATSAPIVEIAWPPTAEAAAQVREIGERLACGDALAA